ncbi:MAG: hypothetical protein DMG41_32290 [Acidobacteria bacterium]|nr:MAG: hypothetical protein AUH13_30580 [Acidobacteria bacterium 13_2_20CM_58_27]PYT82999.1 MAG: hypothetical protein DMG41_32290 [Acidobacteriota bacterium]
MTTDETLASYGVNGFPVVAIVLLDKVLKDTERQQIVNALKQSNWIISGAQGAAARLGMKRSTLQARIANLGI